MNTFNKKLNLTEQEDGTLTLSCSETGATSYVWEYRIPQANMIMEDPENPGTDISIPWRETATTSEFLDLTTFAGIDLIKVYRCRVVKGGFTRYTDEYRINYGLNN